ncbi:MAG: hypothetical protein GXO11_07880 [Epsilonproteobacteria bacterium]|nr:hypothetical protein [Campylobacterota bacterium]
MTRKYHSKLIPAGIIFTLSAFAGHLIPLSVSNENMLQIIITNLTPAMIFLYALDLDIKTLLKNQVGCSCKMGAKKYWLILLLAIGISVISQLLAPFLYDTYQLYISSAIAFILGYIASFTKLKTLNGTEDIATTMLYLLSAVIGFHLF